MNTFAWALAGFVLLHIGVSATGLRSALVGRLGERGYRIGFGLASLILVVALVMGFSAMRADPFDPLNELLWIPPAWARWPAVALTLIGFVMAVAGILTSSPMRIGNEVKGLQQPEPARGIVRITRHPFLWGVALWSLAHLLTNGERFAVALFGALGLMALYGTRSIDRKSRARDPEAWDRFVAVSSNVPFAAIIQGRNRLDLGEIGWRFLVGLAIFAIVGWLHRPPVF